MNEPRGAITELTTPPAPGRSITARYLLQCGCEADRANRALHTVLRPRGRRLRPALAEYHRALALSQDHGSCPRGQAHLAAQHDNPITLIDWSAPDGRAAHTQRADRRLDFDVRAVLTFNLAADKQERSFGNSDRKRTRCKGKGIVDDFIDDHCGIRPQRQLSSVLQGGLKARGLAAVADVLEIDF